MNAKEFAHELEKAASFIRQQQAEIEALKYEKSSGVYDAEPVAWMHKTATNWVSTFIHPETEPDEWIPLYTHPADLTDDEIDIETTRALNDLNGSDYQLIDVAQLIAKYLMQAILRKAQEK